jgi:flagellar protein FlgJ
MSQTGLEAAGAGRAAALAPGVDPLARAQERAALEKAARGFEAIFTRQLLATMRSASLGESLTDSSAVEQFQEMSDANMADGLAGKGGLGIAGLILQQLDRTP